MIEIKTFAGVLEEEIKGWEEDIRIYKEEIKRLRIEIKKEESRNYL